MHSLKHNKKPRRLRKGVAAAEMAVVSPLLMLLLLAAIDVGQYANVGQVVSNASRVGARAAARNDTANTSSVEAAVRTYIAENYPSVSASALTAASNINVSGGTGPVPGGDLSSLDEGAPITVTVSLQFDTVRWLNGIATLGGRTITATTLMRRE